MYIFFLCLTQDEGVLEEGMSYNQRTEYERSFSSPLLDSQFVEGLDDQVAI